MTRAREELATRPARTRALAGEYPTREAAEHDEAMRMQALAISVQTVNGRAFDADTSRSPSEVISSMAHKFYREATGREWHRGSEAA